VSKYGSWRGLNDIRSNSIDSNWSRNIRSVCGNGENGKWFDENGNWL